MAQQLTVEIQGLDKLVKKLGKVEGPIRPMLEEAAKYAMGQAKVFAKPHPVDKGTLANAMKYELAPGPVPLHARVYPAGPVAGIANTIEEGRKAGKPPPIASIGRWAERHGITVKAYVLAKQIAKSGTKGVFFMRRAAEATEKKMGDLVKDAIKRMESDWGK